MTVPPPPAPKLYHIVHVDRLPSIVADGGLLCDAALQAQPRPGTTIGMNTIKQRRLINPLKCHPGLNVGGCVPFCFCPRSVMLYVIHKANHCDLAYRGGQNLIVHLEADLRGTVDWAERNGRRWAFTLSNAGSWYFQDRCDLTRLDEIDWDAVEAKDGWCDPGIKKSKQAEFLVERFFSWTLVQRVGVRTIEARDRAAEALRAAAHQPDVTVRQEWYY